jgi:hypothetical protein
MNLPDIFSLFVKAVRLVKKDFWAVLQTMILLGLFGAGYLGFLYIQREIDLVKQEVKPPDESGLVLVTSTNDKQINEVLDHLRVETDGSRARVYQYHNGQKSIGDVHFLYASATHEVVAPGVSTEIKNLQRMPSSLFAEGIADHLQKKTRCVSTNEVDSAARQILKNQAITYVCSAGIFKGSELTGMVVVNFVGYTVPENDRDRIKSELTIASIRISDALYSN